MGETTGSILAWHFGAATGLLRDGHPVPQNGETLRYNGHLIMCESGLHASIRAIDALQYAPGPIVYHVRCSGNIQHDHDKLICRERTVEWRLDATDILCLFARQCSLDVAYLWDMPDVVRRYLETGDKTIRDAARDAAWAATWAATWDAAWAAQNKRLESMLIKAHEASQ